MTFSTDSPASSKPPSSPKPFVVRAGEARDPRSSGRSLAKATSSDTAGTLGLLRSELVEGLSAPLHLHTLEDEAWIVEHGDIEYVFSSSPVRGEVDPSDLTTEVVGEGDFVFVPRGHAHGMTVLSEAAAVWTMVVPGGLEDFLLDRDEADPSNQTGAGVDLERFGITIYPGPD